MTTSSVMMEISGAGMTTPRLHTTRLIRTMIRFTNLIIVASNTNRCHRSPRSMRETMKNAALKLIDTTRRLWEDLNMSSKRMKTLRKLTTRSCKVRTGLEFSLSTTSNSLTGLFPIGMRPTCFHSAILNLNSAKRCSKHSFQLLLAFLLPETSRTPPPLMRPWPSFTNSGFPTSLRRLSSPFWDGPSTLLASMLCAPMLPKWHILSPSSSTSTSMMALVDLTLSTSKSKISWKEFPSGFSVSLSSNETMFDFWIVKNYPLKYLQP